MARSTVQGLVVEAVGTRWKPLEALGPSGCSQVPKLDVASAFEEAVCVEGKQLEAGNIELVSLGSIPVVKGCLEHKLHQVAWGMGKSTFY